MADAARLDPRITPARGDIAAAFLRGQVTAARYVEGEIFAVIAPQAPLRRAPRPDVALDTEALYGEHITVYDRTEDGWAWGQLEQDGYVGWIPEAALARPGPMPTHKVAALRTLIFPGPSIKVPPLEMLPFGAMLAVETLAPPFAALAAGGHVPLVHLVPVSHTEADPVAVAERLLGAPYLWGGRSSLGLDCSALVQTALTACGISCPRDSDMQEAALGVTIGLKDIRRGDLLFWPGHVAMARDTMTMIHANAFHMAVAIEPIEAALARIAATGSTLSSVRRVMD